MWSNFIFFVSNLFHIMKKVTFLKALVVLIALLILIKILTTVILEPWIGNKIETALNDRNEYFTIDFDKVHISLIQRGIQLTGITIQPKGDDEGHLNFNGEIASVECKGIKLTKALFNNGIDIREITISHANLKGKMLFADEAKTPMLSPQDIRLGKVFIDQIDIAINDVATSQSYSVKKGVSTFYDLQVEKHDTISSGNIKEFDFEADEFLSVSKDSMYTFKTNGMSYSRTSNELAIDTFFVHPNYSDENFTSRYKFQTDRVEGVFSSIYVHDFSASDLLKSNSMISSFIEVGHLDLKVYRDRRNPFRHANKTPLQDLLYNYPGDIHIDSIGLKSGNIIYTEHAELANEPGRISFNKTHAKIYKVTNDTIYKTKKDFLVMRAQALLMGKGHMTILLNGEIYDPQNTFSLSGTLSAMDAKAINPMLEKIAYIYITTGKIDKIDFNFTANNTRAAGSMHLLYHDFGITLKNKQTDDTTAFKERVSSYIANSKLLDANSLQGEDKRTGLIEYERDPEKSFVNYCFKAILSGILSSISKRPEKN